MKSIGLFSQIGAVIVAIGIGYYYVQPTITEIGNLQTDIAEYQTERKKIEAINDTLAQKVATYQGISRVDKQKLAIYMPRTIDDINILRDITFIAQEAQVVTTALAYDGAETQSSSRFSEDDVSGSSLGDLEATPHPFTVDVQGSYTDIKQFLLLLEQNEYPLEVHQLSLAVDEFGTMSASMTLITYVDELVLVNRN